MHLESPNTTNISVGDMKRVWEKIKAVVTTTWARTGRRWRVLGCLLVLLSITGILTHSNLDYVPRLRLEYSDPSSSLSSGASPPPTPTTPTSFSPQGGGLFNTSKVALLIEDRALPHLAPLLLHFVAVVPPDWRFRFMGSPASVAALNGSHAVRAHVASGKLDLTLIPSNMSTNGQEMISRFLTNLWLYETVLRPAEWLLLFQTDSILCANSRQSLNDFLEYDWVGAPWNPSGRFGGNGGLSLRRNYAKEGKRGINILIPKNATVDILRDQVRIDGSEPEDVWLTERLGHRPGARMANGSLSLTFSGEMNAGQAVQIPSLVSPSISTSPSPSSPTATSSSSSSSSSSGGNGYYIEGIDDWRDGFYEPMGYHTGGSGSMLHAGIWGDPRRRKHIWGYCPEVKMTLAMDAAKYVPGDCGANWKRDGKGVVGTGSVGIEDLGYGTEIIDGIVYPRLPPNLAPW
ncbi:hypothetical protein F4859DRAFT_510682 [Xylaria cf. heliscus]|nr:hypothetical protein F4859DRAFT_510682 [Xylaria cf. heliscus]